jgi:hypothetical protein
MSWAFGEAKIAVIRARVASWHVHETVAQRAATCRQCGETIAKGEVRLTFKLDANKKVRWQEREAHIHLVPCNPLLKDPDSAVHLPPWHVRA